MGSAPKRPGGLIFVELRIDRDRPGCSNPEINLKLIERLRTSEVSM
jgi:hypothetical protein